MAGKAVTRAEKTKGTKPIGKIKLTPVTLSLSATGVILIESALQKDVDTERLHKPGRPWQARGKCWVKNEKKIAPPIH